jgi:uncharacterized repeat protein (TIGR01451 family)/fimbrial isopeptide formation D2 family protein
MERLGVWQLMSRRTRRALTLSWAAIFILSLLLQYAALSAPSSALAAHDVGLFELDGNAIDQAAAGADWQNGAEGSLDQFFVGAADEAAANDNTYFTTGGSKDENDVTEWAVTSTGVPDKDELTDAYAAVYELNGETWVYFGADRFDNDGDAQIGFWFFQDDIGVSGGGFTGAHVDGDVLILSEYTNGGVVDLVCAYEWDGSGGGDNIANAGDCDPATNGSNLNLVAAGAECDVADGTFDICAVTNAATATAPWPFTNKDGEHDFATGQFFEGGINLTDMFGGAAPCFGSMLAETRSSQETDAQLKDFALGDFNTCVPPDIETESSVSSADFGDDVTDIATFSGSNGEVTGTATFFICTPAQVTAAGCPSGGTQVGDTVTIDNESATSEAYTVGLTAAAAGKYCWRVEYVPDQGSNYLAASHTNAGSECFTVAPAVIDITKSADDATVTSGDQIGFTVTVTNTGAGTALGVTVSDPLPAGTGIDWSIDDSASDDGWSITGSAPDQTLEFGPATLGSGESSTVHVVSDTGDDSCGTYLNIASVTTSNDGSDEAGATTEVVDCPVPELGIEKSNNAPIETIDLGDGTTIDLPTAEEGETVTFTLDYTVADEVTNAVIEDVLPEGYTYVDGTASSDAQFTFVDYDDASRTLTWEADSVSSNGSLTYDVTIDEGAADLQQPLINVATIDSDETPPDSDDSPVFVPPLPLELTPPPTDVVADGGPAGNPGFALMLILFAITGLALGIGFMTPIPERVRRRDRLG